MITTLWLVSILDSLKMAIIIPSILILIVFFILLILSLVSRIPDDIDNWEEKEEINTIKNFIEKRKIITIVFILSFSLIILASLIPDSKTMLIGISIEKFSETELFKRGNVITDKALKLLEYKIDSALIEEINNTKRIDLNEKTKTGQ